MILAACSGFAQDAVAELGPIPDLELVLHAGDSPRSQAHHPQGPRTGAQGGPSAPLPMLGHCKREGFYDILVPYGHFWEHDYDSIFFKKVTPWSQKSKKGFGRFTTYCTRESKAFDSFRQVLPHEGKISVLLENVCHA
ncbi:hypothetical protein CYMTET_56605 [Cymbomonas tetramitiformis]|uniref:Glycosyl transferase CAP10 domain-containing protein n=1 Tax=Cymbomonas tetramitiformis TaxID=36881 RepID=A0AAE0EME0_9CHLO|nr:hypothetical protein CYMTET_56605 [Cymbomonas tetramitiformis]